VLLNVIVEMWMNKKIDYNLIAEKYAAHRRVHPGVLKELLECGITDESRILEVGCGTGNYVTTIQQLTDCSAYGIDPHEGMLEIARQKDSRVSFQIGRAELLDFPDDHFDLVYNVDVIHHVEDRPEAYRQAYRVLRPGGLVCTVTDSEDIIHRRKPLSNYFPETVPLELRRYARMADLMDYMSAAGFVKIEEMNVEMALKITDIQKYRDKAYSSLHLISAEAFAQGIRRMEQDLAVRPIDGLSLYALLWGTKQN